MSDINEEEQFNKNRAEQQKKHDQILRELQEEQNATAREGRLFKASPKLFDEKYNLAGVLFAGPKPQNEIEQMMAEIHNECRDDEAPRDEKGNFIEKPLEPGEVAVIQIPSFAKRVIQEDADEENAKCLVQRYENLKWQAYLSGVEKMLLAADAYPHLYNDRTSFTCHIRPIRDEIVKTLARDYYLDLPIATKLPTAAEELDEVSDLEKEEPVYIKEEKALLQKPIKALKEILIRYVDVIIRVKNLKHFDNKQAYIDRFKREKELEAEKEEEGVEEWMI